MAKKKRRKTWYQSDDFTEGMIFTHLVLTIMAMICVIPLIAWGRTAGYWGKKTKFG